MLEKISNSIDQLSTKQGQVSALLGVPLLVVVMYEVVMRYVFDAPTSWGFEMTTFLYGVHYMLGLSYCDVTGGHVRVDIFTARMPLKGQAVMGLLTGVVFFLPVTALMTVYSWKYAWVSIVGRELNSTSWAPPIYPVKALMALAFTLLLLQGISNILQNILVLRGKAGAVR